MTTRRSRHNVLDIPVPEAPRRRLRPRKICPDLSSPRARRGPLAKLAWIFSFTW
jgi:hypothetical protein